MSSKGEQTRRRILDEATGLILRKGIGSTSIGDVLEAASIHKGSLYFHFKDKKSIVREVLRESGDQFLAFVDETLKGDSPRAALENFFTAALDLHCCRGFEGGCLFGNTALEACDLDSELAAEVDDFFVRWTARLETVIVDGQRRGSLRSDVDGRELAQQIVASLEGGIMLARLRKDAAPLKNAIQMLGLLLWGPLEQDTYNTHINSGEQNHGTNQTAKK